MCVGFVCGILGQIPMVLGKWSKRFFFKFYGPNIKYSKSHLSFWPKMQKNKYTLKMTNYSFFKSIPFPDSVSEGIPKILEQWILK